MVYKNGVKHIQATAYNGARTVHSMVQTSVRRLGVRRAHRVTSLPTLWIKRDSITIQRKSPTTLSEKSAPRSQKMVPGQVSITLMTQLLNHVHLASISSETANY